MVVVSYNTKDKLRRCLESIESHHQVIVVDNNSNDGSPQMVATEFPQVKIVQNSENRGFGQANNQGAKLGSRRLLLFLNSDAYPLPGSIDTLASIFEDDSIVAAGPMLLNLDGSIQDSTANRLTLWAVFCEQSYLEKLIRKSRFFSPYWTTNRLVKAGSIQTTPQVMGAALMCRSGLEEFDERFFLYCEDTDLCLRLSKRGRIVYVPTARVLHELGSSSSASRWRAVARYNRGKELYFQIHHGRLAMATCWLFNRTGALLRLMIWSIATVLTLGCVKPFRDRVQLFSLVLVAPREGPTRS